MSARGPAGSSNDYIGDFQFDIDKIDVSAWGISDFSQIQALLANSSAGATLNAYYSGLNHFITVANVSAASLISQRLHLFERRRQERRRHATPPT